MEGRVAWKSANDQMNRVPRSIDDVTTYVQELNGQNDFILKLVFGNIVKPLILQHVDVDFKLFITTVTGGRTSTR